MKIEELIAGMGDSGTVQIEGMEIPVPVLRRLMAEGYGDVRAYPDNRTFSIWGKNCTACFTEEQLREQL